MRRVLITIAVAAAAAALFQGCSSMMRLNIKVQLDAKEIEASGTVPTIEVNIIGVNEAEMPQWRDYSIDAFWSPDDNLRKGAAPWVVKFGETMPLERTLTDDDAVWDIWNKKTAKQIFVIADIPGFSGARGAADGRLLVLPLDPGAWSGHEVTVTVKSGGLTCAPSPKIKQ